MASSLTDNVQDIYTNTRSLWHPPGARGIYGGAAIAQSLAAAQKTIPPPSPSNNHAVFLIHSMHCYFVLAGDASIPILYHVERVREGKSFMTRTVQARQRGKCIFTTTASFVREGSGGQKTVDHGWDMPEGVQAELERGAELEDERVKLEKASNGEEESGAFESRRLGIMNSKSNEQAVSHSVPIAGYQKPEELPQCLPSNAEASLFRRLRTSAHQAHPPMVPGSRPHLPLGRPTSPPLRSRLHVGQLLYRHGLAGAQPLALRAAHKPLSNPHLPSFPCGRSPHGCPRIR